MRIKKNLKRLIFFFFVPIISLIGIFIAWLNLFFEPENYREQLIEWIEVRTDHQVSLNGKIDFEFDLIHSKPFLKFAIEDTSIRQDNESNTDPIFSASLIEIRFQLSDLLSAKIRPKLKLVNPYVKIDRADSNKTNWDLMAINLWNDRLETPELKLIQIFTGFVISGLTIKNGNFIWSRTDTENHFEISRLNVKNEEFRNMQSIDVYGQLKCRGSFCRSHNFVEMEFNFDLMDNPELVLAQNISFDMSNDGDLISSHVKKIELDTEKIQVRMTNGKVAGLVKNKEFVLEFAKGLYSEGTDDVAFTGIYGRWVNANIDSSIDLAEATFDSVRTRLIPDLTSLLSVNQSDLFKAFVTMVNYSFKGSGDIKFFANNWENTLMNEFFKNDRSNVVEGLIKVNTGVHGLEIENFVLDWEKSNFHGSLIPKDRENYALNFEIFEDAVELSQIVLMDIDNYDYPSIGFLVFILTNFPDLELTGDIKVNRLEWGKIQADSLEIPLRRFNHRLHINHAHFGIFGGKADVSVKANQSMQDIVVEFEQTYSNVDIGDFLASIGVSENIKAIGDVHAEIIMKDSILPNSMNSIEAEIVVNIPEGDILNLDKNLDKSSQLDQLREQLTFLFGLQLDLDFLLNKVKFYDLAATIVVSDGQLFSDDISFNALGWQLSSRSTYNLIDDWYDSIWYVSPNNLNRILKGKVGEKLSTIIFPFRVSGKSNAIEIVLDLPELFRAL